MPILFVDWQVFAAHLAFRHVEPSSGAMEHLDPTKVKKAGGLQKQLRHGSTALRINDIEAGQPNVTK